MTRSLRIAQIAPPMEAVPPRAYGGTERVIHSLVVELQRRGHDVTTFASGDSSVPGRLVTTIDEAIRPSGRDMDPVPYMLLTMQEVLARATDFDVIHSHLEWASLLLARSSPVPVVSTFHGRLDLPWAPAMFQDAPRGLVAISESQASAHPSVPWERVVHNGLHLDDAPFERRRSDGLAFVGRIAPEKGAVEAIEIARLSGRPLTIAAKVEATGRDHAFYEAAFEPALRAAGSDVEFVGELPQDERDDLLATSFACLMPGSWPEPFGLVAIEALACGTPVIARRVGALPEIIREGVDGFFGDDSTAMAFNVDRVRLLDRQAIRASVVDRFSARHMTDGYLAVYQELLRPAIPDDSADGPSVDLATVVPADRLAARRVERLEAAN